MTDKWHGGKGSKIRKSSNLQKYSDGWDMIFKNKKSEPSDSNTDHKPTHEKKRND